MKKTIKKYTILIFVICILVFIDQFSKYLVCNRLNRAKSYPVLKNIFSFEYLENRGVAFGFLSGRLSLITTIVVIVTLLIIYAIHIIERTIKTCIKLSKTNDANDYTLTIRKFTILQVICVFLTAGSIGNMIDRIRLGYVVDFIKFDFFDFPTFNVADCYVTVSMIVLLVILLFLISEDELELLKIRK